MQRSIFFADCMQESHGVCQTDIWEVAFLEKLTNQIHAAFDARKVLMMKPML